MRAVPTVSQRLAAVAAFWPYGRVQASEAERAAVAAGSDTAAAMRARLSASSVRDAQATWLLLGQCGYGPC